MHAKYGKSLGQTLFLILQVYDAYRELWKLVDKLPESNSTADKEALALQKACAGICATPNPLTHPTSACLRVAKFAISGAVDSKGDMRIGM